VGVHIRSKRIADTIVFSEHLASAAANGVDALGLRLEAKVRVAKLVSAEAQTWLAEHRHVLRFHLYVSESLQVVSYLRLTRNHQ
jgi:hypothetical protein